MLLNEGVKVYETIPELVQHWLDKGIAELKEFENTCIPARKFKPFEKRAILIEERRSDVELVKGLMTSLYKITNNNKKCMGFRSSNLSAYVEVN